MERNVMKELISWKQSSIRKPLNNLSEFWVIMIS